MSSAQALAAAHQSNNVTSVAIRFKEEFVPVIHQKSLGLVVVFDFASTIIAENTLRKFS
jgi:hypothetical protein